MPAKFKPSERKYARTSFGRRVDSQGAKKQWTHYWLKGQTVETLINAINSDRTKPKHKQKFRNELARRGVKLMWVMPDGTQIEKDRRALAAWYERGAK